MYGAFRFFARFGSCPRHFPVSANEVEMRGKKGKGDVKDKGKKGKKKEGNIRGLSAKRDSNRTR